MNNAKSGLFLSLSLALAFIITVGLSYAYFSARIVGKESASTITLSAGVMEINYSEGNGIIELLGIYPKDDAWATKTFTVTGKNSTDLKMNYKMGIEIEENTFSSGSLTYSLENIVNDGGNPVNNIDGPIVLVNGTQLLGYGSFNKGMDIKHTYTIKIYFKNNGKDQNENQKARFKGKIVLGEINDGTLLAAILSNRPTATRETIPGRQVATSNEGLRATKDDYGTTYYYRGAIGNNYVSFADMCWRIVRVTGDGSIKLVLSNYMKRDARLAINEANADNPCASVYNGNTNAFARYDDTTNGKNGISVYNTAHNKNTYAGFMISNTPNASTYDGTHANDKPNTALSNLMKWYNLYIKDYEEKLADVIWCNDISVGSFGNGIGSNPTRYAADGRLDTNPTLVCPDASGTNKKLSKFTAKDTNYGNGALTINENTYMIGLLTADEVAYAGGHRSTSNESFYLYTNAHDRWWTMTPYGYVNTEGTHVRVYPVINYIATDSYIYNAHGLRPAIALKSDITIKDNGATGTAAKPYIIN